MALNIREASELTGVSKDMIRRYERLGLLSPQRSQNNYRTFTLLDTDRIVFIKCFSNLGVSLKSLARVLQGGDLNEMTGQIAQKLEELKVLEKHLTSRIKTSELFLRYFNQYQSGVDYVLSPAIERLLYVRTKENQQVYTQLCRRILDAHGTYQYCYRVKMETEEDRKTLSNSDVGIFLFPPLPFEISGVQTIAPSLTYQAIIPMPLGVYVGKEQLLPHLETIHGLGYRTAGDLFLYQLAQVMREGAPRDLICLEIPVTLR